MTIESKTAVTCEGQQTLFDGQVPKIEGLEEQAKANPWSGINIISISHPGYPQLGDRGRKTIWDGGSVNINPTGIQTLIPRHKPVLAEQSSVQKT